jgi:Cytochrome P460
MSIPVIRFRRLAAAAAAVGALAVAGAILAQNAARSPAALDAARYTSAGELEFPTNTDEWIAVGAGLGGDYEETPFDPSNPGTITMVRMEPSAYRYLRDNGRYADGTMLLLTFYQTQQKPEPQLRGFVQGDVAAREIHVIDRARFREEGRAFFVYPGATQSVAAKMPVGSECVVCHAEHGQFDSTFSQFYPLVRERVRQD